MRALLFMIFRYINILFGNSAKPALFSFSISIYVIIKFLMIRHNLMVFATFRKEAFDHVNELC